MVSLNVGFFIALSSCLILPVFSVFSQDLYEESILEERAEKDKSMRSRKNSPLQKGDRKHFDHLSYYPVDETWRWAVEYDKLSGKDTVDFATSSGRVKRFVRHARLRFSKNGEDYSFYAYKRAYPEGYVPRHAPYLFIPFTDLTTGEETYGGGRYIDIEVPEDDATSVILDFNQCYNPYCAYGDGFSCPIPPKDNFLDLKIEAGEKDYKH